MDGPLLREGHLANLEAPAEEALVPRELPLDIISGLLGRQLTHQFVVDLIDRVGVALAAEREYEKTTGRHPPDLWAVQLRSVLNLDGFGIPEEYSPEEIEAQRLRSAVYSDFLPIANAMTEYARLSSVAERFDLMLRTPLPTGISPLRVKNLRFVPAKGDAAIQLLRIVAHELGRTTHRSTLAGTLQLAREPATVDLRAMMNVWLDRLYAGDEGELRRIQREIRRASEQLAKLPNVRSLGRATAIIGVPIAIAEMLLALPPVLGLSVSVVGLPASRDEDRRIATFRWATFGGI